MVKTKSVTNEIKKQGQMMASHESLDSQKLFRSSMKIKNSQNGIRRIFNIKHESRNSLSD